METFGNLFKKHKTPTQLNRAAYEATYRQTGRAEDFEFCTDSSTGASCTILSIIISKRDTHIINKVTHTHTRTPFFFSFLI